MIRNGFRAIAIAIVLGCALTSCSGDGIVSTEETVAAVSAADAHDLFVRAFLDRCPDRGPLDREERIDLYVLVARDVCRKHRFDYEPSREEMDRFLAVADEWREAGVWDIFDPAAHSPLEAVSGLAEMGAIPREHMPSLRRLFDDLRRPTVERETEPAEGCEEVSAIAGLLESSCALWAEIDDGRIVPVPVDDELVAKWWKTVAKYIGVGACDGLSGAAAFYLTGGNPFATGFFGGIASVAAKDAFEERGW